MHVRVAKFPHVEKGAAFRQHGHHVRALFEDDQRARHQPAAGNGSGDRLFAKPLPIGRIGKEKVEGFEIADLAEIGRIPGAGSGRGLAARASRYCSG